METSGGDDYSNLSFSISRNLRLLKVPKGDLRREYSNRIFHFVNTFDFSSLSHFVHQYCSDDFIFQIKGNNTLGKCERRTYFPRSITMQGAASFMKFVTSHGECAPDRVYVVTETIIRNRIDCAFIHNKFSFSGTLIYRLQMKFAANGVEIKQPSIENPTILQ